MKLNWFPSSLLLVTLYCLFQSVSSAAIKPKHPSIIKTDGKGAFHNVTAYADLPLPPLIPGRIKMPSNIPTFDLTMEQQAIKLNGKLPKNEPNQFGLAIHDNVTVPTTQRYRHLAASLSSKIEKGISIAASSTVDVLKHHASLSFIAYCNSVIPGKKWSPKLSTCKTCVDHSTVHLVDIIDSDSFTDASGYIVRDDSKKTIFLVFRGTSSFGNAVADMVFILTKYHPVGNGAKVHKGFYDSYMNIQKRVLSLMADQLTQFPNYHVTVTGHSLGGAYATLAALDLYQRDKRFHKKNMNIVTFGEPRVGNPAFAAYGVSTGIVKKRVVYRKDIVSHVPPMMIGYLHFGTEYWVQKDHKTVKICDTSYEHEACSNSIVPFTSLADHAKYFNIAIDFCASD